MPVRIQRKRKKGWKAPDGAVYVGRGSVFGNPFRADECREAGYRGTADQIAKRCKESFSIWLGRYWQNVWMGPVSEQARKSLLLNIERLRGKDLMCWCGLDQPCHADVLLDLANPAFEAQEVTK